MTVAGRPAPLSRAGVVRAAETTLRAERRRALLSISFVGRDRMRGLNRRWRGESRVTDVLAFPLPAPLPLPPPASGGFLAGDIYICRWQAAREARARGIALREELTRLVVHGVLHILGHQHPEGPERVASPMWRRQERIVRRLLPP